MSTRSTIKLVNGKDIYTYYHHYDGYLTGVGAELSDFLNTEEYTKDIDTFKSVLEKKGYELITDGTYMGWIEYLYEINFKKKNLKCYCLGDEGDIEEEDGVEYDTYYYIKSYKINSPEETEKLYEDFGKVFDKLKKNFTVRYKRDTGGIYYGLNESVRDTINQLESLKSVN